MTRATLLLILLLTGCGSTRIPPVDSVTPGSTPTNVLIGLSLWGTRIAGLIFLLCAVGIFLAPPGYRVRILLAMGAACALMIGAQVLAFVGAHLALVAGLVLLAALIAALAIVWLRRRWLIHQAEGLAGRDLNGDGTIGAPEPTP